MFSLRYFEIVTQKIYYMTAILPIEIINIILLYVCNLNRNILMLQYEPLGNKEVHKINFQSDSLWRIQSIQVMKRLYPVYYSPLQHQELYYHGIQHYEKQLREKK
jgi:hypothetical protein